MTRALPAFVALALAGFAQDFSETRLELLGRNWGYTEGPAWSPKDNFLIFSDTPGDRLLKWVPGANIEVYRAAAGGPSGNAFDADGRLYTCESRARRVTRTDRKGVVEVLAEKWQGKRFNSPNDIAVSRNGHVYFTDPAFGDQADRRELDFYGVYHLPPKGELKLVAKPAGRPNGIALSPNGRILYVANSDEGNVRAYDLDRNGDASNERVLISGIAGVPGGIQTDEAGNIFVTGAGVYIYNAQGKQLHFVEMKSRPSNCAFGEADRKTLFITSGPNVYRARFDAK
jgi:gluconolactonase